MQILDNLIIISIHVLCFIAGLKLSDHYHREAMQNQKDALERQYLRLKTKSDADDPCKPYNLRGFSPPVVAPVNFEEQPPSPIPQEFLDDLQANGKAKMSFRKSDLTK